MTTNREVLPGDASRVEELAIRVGSLIAASFDAFQEFLLEVDLLFTPLPVPPEEQTDDRPTNGASTQASS